MDEITTTTTSRVSELHNGRVVTYELDPLDYIEGYASADELEGGDPVRNAAMTRAILGGEAGACRDIVCLNAAAGIAAAGKVETVRDGWDMAQESIDSGRAERALDGLIKMTQAG